MAVTAVALADLCFSLRFAAARYRIYADTQDPAQMSPLLILLADERDNDADDVNKAASESGVSPENPIINHETAGPLLGMGEGRPNSAASVIFRVQRAESTLARMAAQLASLSPKGTLRDALLGVRAHIEEHREDVRAARRRAQALASVGVITRMIGKEPTEGQDVVIWFGTNRSRALQGHFAGERAESVTHGRCRVFVPSDRELGSLGRNILGRIIKGDDRVKLTSVQILRESQFWEYLAKEVTALDAEDKQGLVFLHGYNTKFVDAARRTAQLKVDLAHKGPAAFFSWPSLGSPVGYTGDEAAIDGSEQAIQGFLVDFARRSGVSVVHIIAHSMGNRGLLRAMNAIATAAASETPVQFGQIILAAPDVDAQLFRNLAAAYSQLAKRATLYITRNDKAIAASRWLHGFARVGLAPPVAVVPGIDTIDASHVNLSLLGHSYAAEMLPVLTDIQQLMQTDTEPNRRRGLRKANDGNAKYWEFV